MPSLPAQPQVTSLLAHEQGSLVAIPFLFLAFLPGREGRTCGRRRDGQIRSKCGDAVKGEKSTSLMQRTQVSQQYLTPLSPETINKAINGQSTSK